MGTVASPLRLFFELASRGSGQREALSWHPAPPRPVVRWTYRRLWFAAVDGAKLLVSSGAVPSAASASRGQNAVAVAVEEGVELVVAFLAIALAGAVIVPISAKEPPARSIHLSRCELRRRDCGFQKQRGRSYVARGTSRETGEPFARNNPNRSG